MDTKLHNINFYKTEPFGINCLALSEHRLALSRTDASIEVWTLLGSPLLIKRVPGEENGSVEALGWFDKRLFSTGLSGRLIEWDLQTLSPKFSILLTGYAAWCLHINVQISVIAVGTEQGYINMYRINENDIAYEKLFDKQEGRIICCKFNKTGDILATGSEGIIRVWNVQTGQATHRMMVSQRGKNNLVWDLVVLDDMTIISADSSGKLIFWDGNIGEQIESFVTHRQDTLSLCVSDSQDLLYCSGVDPLIVSLMRVKKKKHNNSSFSWIKHVQRHIHEHDVRCLVLYENKLISAGADGYLTFSSFPPKWLMRLPPLIANPRAQVSAKNKLILLRYNKHLEVWKLGSHKKSKKGYPVLLTSQKSIAKENDCNGIEKDSLSKIILNNLEESSTKRYAAIDKDPIKLISVTSRKNKPITSCALSPNGAHIAYSTDNHLGVFKLETDGDSQMLSKILPLPDDCQNVILMTFADANTLILAIPSKLIILLIDENAGAIIQQSLSYRDLLKEDILSMVTSQYGKYLAISDCSGCLSLWKRSPKKIYSSYATLPRLSHLPSAMTFDSAEKIFIVVCTDQKIIEYHLEERRVDTSINDKLPVSWKERQSAIDGVYFHPTVPNVLIFYDFFSMWILNKNSIKEKSKKQAKKIVASEDDNNFKIRVIPFKYLAAFHFLEDDEAVAVQLLPDSIVSQLPPMYDVKRHVEL